MLTVSLIMIYALLLVNVGNYISGAAAIATALNINLPVAMCIIAVVSTFYYVFGGLRASPRSRSSTARSRSSAWPDPRRRAVCDRRHPPDDGRLPPHYFTWDGTIGVPTIFAWTIGTIGAIFSTQFIMQAISSAQNANEARRSPTTLRPVLPARHRARPDRRCAKFLHPS